MRAIRFRDPCPPNGLRSIRLLPQLFRKFTKRFAFRDEGASAARELLGVYGGRRVVHGHSPIPYLLGESGSEDGSPDSGPQIDGPHVYADGLAVALDGGVTMAGKLLVSGLPLAD